MVNQVSVSTVSQPWFLIILNYPKIKKSLLSYHILKNNFKITQDICQENACQFKYHSLSKYF